MRTNPSDGFMGAFMFPLAGVPQRVCVIASDEMGWQHVSVSFGNRSVKTPSWEIMSRVKELFWEEDDVVIQFHPAKKDHINNHPGCLHLWRCTDGREQPLPPAIMVGYKDPANLTAEERTALQEMTEALRKFNAH